ncbi:MAG: polysaccharide biosynthesis protein [Aquificae bacterium]|nr:polysaccharide biosynthesis protein [Aquificota bacterium]
MINNLLKPTKKKRLLFFLISDVIIFSLSFYLSFLLRFDFDIPDRYLQVLPYWLVIIVAFKIFALAVLKSYSFNWRFVSINELLRTSLALILTNSILFIINIFLQLNQQLNPYSIPKTVLVIDLFISLIIVSFLRIAKRVYLELISSKSRGKRTAIIGAGSSGEQIARSLKKNPDFNPVFFVDDDDMKIGTKIHGIPIVGKIKDLPYLLKENKIETVIIAIPSATHKEIKKIFEMLTKNDVKDIKIVPSLSKLPKDIISVKDLKDLSIEDLLSREPIKIEEDKVKEFLKGKKIFVSGAGGSIGSEIVRQLIKFEPDTIVAFEIDETELHNLSLELKEKIKEKNINFFPVVGDVRDKSKLENVFKRYKPDIVFHAAAYKHVPLMEDFPEEAVKTNIVGTYNLAITSIENGVEKFVNISTDKAVNPTSIMGATKRMAEMICSALNGIGKTKFVSVRFGNVLGSRGSVVPIFLEQIKKGGPITVTHPEMKRYFMTISEAVLLVFQAAAMGKGGEVFVLDMGEPVKIVKLAETLIRLQGLEPYKDIDIVFTGLRPGEKLFEELLTAEEGTDKTYHSKIYIARISKTLSLDDVEFIIKYIQSNPHPEEIKEFLKRYVKFGDGN